jgi:hypothetical protein
MPPSPREPIRAMTLGNMRANGVRSLAVTGDRCHGTEKLKIPADAATTLSVSERLLLL